MNDLEKEYFDWMCELVEAEKRRSSYYMLLNSLNHIDFDYSIDMDGNRFDDGVNLRYRFGYERNIPDAAIVFDIDYHNCSVFEMMVALSLKCEEHIMNDPELGDRTYEWFWEMIKSLGLYGMDDRHFDENAVNHIIRKFLERKYKKNGEGGLFTIHDKSRDMRTAEIWYQMNWYLDELIEV